MTPGAEKAYRRYMEAHWGDLSDVENFAETMYRCGFRDSLQAAATFTDVGPSLGRLHQEVAAIRKLWQMMVPDEAEVTR